MTLEQVTIQFKIAEAEEKKAKIKIDQDKILIEKIEALRYLLAETVADPQTTVGSETRYKPVLDEGEMEMVKDKIFDLIKLL